MENVDWEALGKELAVQLKNVVKDLVEGAAADIDKYVREISASLMIAVQRQDAAKMLELKAQLKAVAEINRIRAKQGVQGFAWGALGNVLELTFAMVTMALAKG
jgi:cell division protein ZapA (FtsZ GTPase activity inhibitor)